MISKHLNVITLTCLLLAERLIISLNAAPNIKGPQVPDLFRGPEVFLTVSSEAGYKYHGKNASTLNDRRFILNWHGLSLKPEASSFVGLYDKDPLSLSPNLLRSSVLHMASVTVPSGRVTTFTRYSIQNLTSTSSKCTGYWAALAINGKVIQSNCFKIYPTWMNDIKHVITHIPLHSIMMIGTHNSGAWKTYDGKNSDNVLINYVICQDDSIYQQLIQGIRYLDIRASYYPETEEKFWINHDQFRVRPMEGILADVKQFVNETNEILFIDFHRFPVGFNDTIHVIFVKLLEKVLGPFLAPKSLTQKATPHDLWKLNKNIVLSYADESSTTKHDFLWPAVMQAWGDTNKINQLENFLLRSHHERGCKEQFWASMAHLTFTFEDILAHPDKGIRGFANGTNYKITEWYRKSNWYGRSMIVATDYYLSTNLIEMAFLINNNKAVCVA